MEKFNIACVIDDDPIFIYGVKKVMQIINFCDSVLVYSNGQEALDNLISIMSLKDSLPDVIILDLNMPILDGWQFLDEFVKLPCNKRITIYIASSSIDPEDTLRAKSYEMVSNYIDKPISISVLTDILNDFKAAS
ncbi:two-component system response regulator [Aquimarina sp. SS2-1]|uniref:response regulator n=1 Tax=Aquimarina besae TaxID=3342247 RepID=UPI00366DF8C6